MNANIINTRFKKDMNAILSKFYVCRNKPMAFIIQKHIYKGVRMSKQPMASIINKYIENQIGLPKKAHGFSYYKFEYHSDSNDKELLPP